MNFHGRYESYLQQIPVDIKQYKASQKRLVFGYTSDLDIIVEWNLETFRKILSEYLTEEPAIKECDVIDSMESFARIVSFYMLKGLGGEIEITDRKVVNFLKERFTTHFALGGTCAQAATAFGTIGFPSIVHITDRSREVSRLMDGLGIEVVAPSGRIPILEGASDDLPVQHLILQYPKGARFNILGRECSTPISNRLIMDYDKIHKFVPIDPNFLDYCETNAKDILAYSSSGFNAVIDPDIMTGLIEKLAKHYRKIKEQNPACIICLESAHYMSSKINDIVFERFADSIDLLGMNEEELFDFSHKHHIDVDLKDMNSIITSLEFLVEKYPLAGVVLHTKDYAMYYGDDIEGVDFTKGLTLGNLMASTRARIGRYGTYEECIEILQLPLSAVGVALSNQLEKMQPRHLACLVPARYLEYPTYTIGLGDTFVAGFMISFVK